MTLKAKMTKSLTLKTLIPDIKKSFLSQGNRKIIRDEIKEKIQSGVSPVAGFNRFKKYSKGYAKFKGKFQPVDMKVNGDMLDSMQVRTTKSSFLIAFRSIIADYHNRLGAGRGKVIRRLLPTKNGERFKKDIQNRILRMLEGASRKSIKKQNRRS